ncbi:MAG: hypothetical protein JST81_15475 [Bacteroidetes bacterium]|nr:hypothetical protein [Bacteroidota bacterium]
MKKIVLITLIIVGSFTGFANGSNNTWPTNLKSCNDQYFISRPDTTTYPIERLSSPQWINYVGKPIDTLLSFLDTDFPGFKIGKVYSCGNIKLPCRINIYYGNGRGFMIYVKRFQHLNPYKTLPDGSWDATLFRQENITAIELWDNTVCVFNSNP